VIGNPIEVLTHMVYEAVKERKEQKTAAAANAKEGDEAEAEKEEGKSNSNRADFIDLFLEAEDNAVEFCNDDKAYNKAEKVKLQQLV
jgi:hypothetical protein